MGDFGTLFPLAIVLTVLGIGIIGFRGELGDKARGIYGALESL